MAGLNKFCWFLVLMFFAGLIWGCQPDQKSLDLDQAWDIVKKEILKEKVENKIVYHYDQLLNAGQEIKSWGNTYKVPDQYHQAWLFFVDEQPDANWGHNCLYIFVDKDSGQFTIIKSLSPPDSMDGMTKIYPFAPIQ